MHSRSFDEGQAASARAGGPGWTGGTILAIKPMHAEPSWKRFLTVSRLNAPVRKKQDHTAVLEVEYLKVLR